jgi:hypothetical protein
VNYPVVGGDVFSELPRAHQQIEVGMAVEIEICEIGDRLCGAVGRQLTRPDESSETPSDFNVHQMRRVEVVLFSKEARLNPNAQRRLEKELQRADPSTTITRTRVPHE